MICPICEEVYEDGICACGKKKQGCEHISALIKTIKAQTVKIYAMAYEGDGYFEFECLICKASL